MIHRSALGVVVNPQNQICPMYVRACADGSFSTPSGPDCTFSPCPGGYTTLPGNVDVLNGGLTPSSVITPATNSSDVLPASVAPPYVTSGMINSSAVLPVTTTPIGSGMAPTNPPTFSDPSLLLAYCQANQTNQAVWQPSGSTPSAPTPCQTFLAQAAAAAGGTVTTTTTATTTASWLTDPTQEIFSGVPNWALLAGAGIMGYILMKGGI